VIAALEEQVSVDSVEGSDRDIDTVFEELVDERIEDKLAQLALDADGVALHERLRVLE
jgi:hypothetical protein